MLYPLCFLKVGHCSDVWTMFGCVSTCLVGTASGLIEEMGHRTVDRVGVSTVRFFEETHTLLYL